MDLTREILDELKKPFPEVKWRAGATTKDKTKALALAYGLMRWWGGTGSSNVTQRASGGH